MLTRWNPETRRYEHTVTPAQPRLYRFIGGRLNGTRKSMLDSATQHVDRKVERVESNRGLSPTTAGRIDTVNADETYIRRDITIESSTAKYTETAFVLSTLSQDSDGVKDLVLKGLVETLKGAMATTKKLAIPESTLVKALAYDKHLKVLDVTLAADGNEGRPAGTYRYEEVPQEVVFGLLTADSLGAAYNSSVKGKYPVTKMLR